MGILGLIVHSCGGGSGKGSRSRPALAEIRDGFPYSQRRSPNALAAGMRLATILAAGGRKGGANVRAARLAMLDVQLSLRLLNDLKVLPDKRYVSFLEMAENTIKQLWNWERSEIQRNVAAGVQSPP